MLFHGLFNVGGMFLGEGLAVGQLWTTANVIWTAITSVVFCVLIILIFVKKDFTDIYSRLNVSSEDFAVGEDEGSSSKS